MSPSCCRTSLTIFRVTRLSPSEKKAFLSSGLSVILDHARAYYRPQIDNVAVSEQWYLSNLTLLPNFVATKSRSQALSVQKIKMSYVNKILHLEFINKTHFITSLKKTWDKTVNNFWQGYCHNATPASTYPRRLDFFVVRDHDLTITPALRPPTLPILCDFRCATLTFPFLWTTRDNFCLSLSTNDDLVRIAKYSITRYIALTLSPTFIEIYRPLSQFRLRENMRNVEILIQQHLKKVLLVHLKVRLVLI